MPIELWWWIKPLFLTGFVIVIIVVPLAIWIDNKSAKRWVAKVTEVMILVASLPWIVCSACVVTWVLSNIFILIWRC